MSSDERSIVRSGIQLLQKFLAIKPRLPGSKRKPDSRSHTYQRRVLERYLVKAGYRELDPDILYRNVFYTTLGITLACLLIVITFGALQGMNLLGYVVFIAGVLTAGLLFFWILLLVSVYAYLDLRIYRRTKEVEEVLPDFLQLTSANIFAGMPIDRALWYAVRPRFGVLAREIEDVAKKTIAGEDLEHSLVEFTQKYDSPVLRRSIGLLLEGMKAGGEMTDLLNKIAIDIQESRILRQEMAASVMTYVIFISFATTVVAPFLFGLATQLLTIITSIMGSISTASGSTAGLNFRLSPDSVTVADFRVFAYFVLALSGFFSACIVSAIRKGSVKDGLKNIPIFIIVSWLVYWASAKLIGSMLGGLF